MNKLAKSLERLQMARGVIELIDKDVAAGLPDSPVTRKVAEKQRKNALLMLLQPQGSAQVRYNYLTTIS